MIPVAPFFFLLRADVLDVVLQRNVTRNRLAVTDGRFANQSRVGRQRCASSRRTCASLRLVRVAVAPPMGTRPNRVLRATIKGVF